MRNLEPELEDPLALRLPTYQAIKLTHGKHTSRTWQGQTRELQVLD